MAGTIVASTLSDGTNSTSTTNCIQGSAKAWVTFNGNGSITSLASFNVSSVTRASAGNYTVNFTNAFANANYAVGACQSGTGDAYRNTSFNGPSSTTTTSCNIITYNTSDNGPQDAGRVTLLFTGA
jgi:hypothetical protein